MSFWILTTITVQLGGVSSFIDFTYLQQRISSKAIFGLSAFIRVLFSARYDKNVNLSGEDSLKRVTALIDNYVVLPILHHKNVDNKKLYNEEWSKIPDPYLAERVWCASHAALTKSKFLPVHFLSRGLGEHRFELPADMPLEKSFRWKNYKASVRQALRGTLGESGLVDEIVSWSISSKNKGKNWWKQF